MNKIEKYLTVKEDKSFKRDPFSKAIINCNTSEYTRYLKKARMVQSQKDEIDYLKQEISELKKIVGILVKEKKNG